MALDPNDPMQQALYPVPADLVWPPPEFAGLFKFAPEAPDDPLAVTAGEYGLPSTGAGVPGQVPTPPPPPPPPVQKFGGQPPIEEFAGPVPAAMPPTPDAVSGAGAVVPAVDAISGAGMRVAPPGARDPWEVLDTGAPATPTDDQRLTQAMSALDPRHPELPPEYLSQDELNAAEAAYALGNPIAYAGKRALDDRAEKLHFAQRAADEAKRDAEQQQANIRLQQEGRKRADMAAAQLRQESDNLAADGGFWSSRSDGQKFLGLLSIGLGAFVAGPGGKNQALEIWERSIDRHVANAKRKLADKQSAVAQMYQRVGDDFLANEAMRSATWKAVASQLATEQQNYNPRGATARAYADAITNAVARAAESEQRAAEHGQKQFVEAVQLQLKMQAQKLDQDRLVEQKRHSKAEEGLTGWRIAVDKQQGEKRLAFDEKKFAAEQSKVDSVAIGGNVDNNGAPTPMVQRDGKVFNPDKDVKQKIIAQRTGIQALHDKLGQLKEWRRLHGGTNAKTSPAAQAEYDRLVGSAVREYALAKGMPMGDEADREAARKELLGDDPSKYNTSDVDVRIDKSLRELDAGFNTFLQSSGYTGDRITFIDHPPEAAASKTEKELEGLYAPAKTPNTTDFYQDQGTKLQLLEELQQQAASKNPAVSKTAFDRLHAAVDQANDKFVREKAKEILSTVTASSIPLQGPTGGPWNAPPAPRELMPGTLEYDDEIRRQQRGGAK